jgi:hypothetical protein
MPSANTTARDLKEEIATLEKRLKECLVLAHGCRRGYVSANYRAEARQCVARIRGMRERLKNEYADVEG